MDYKKELEELILNVIHENGSDLHLGVGRVPAIRVSGELVFLNKHSVLTDEDMFGLLGEILDKKKVDQFKENQEADFSYDFRGEARLRGNAFFQKGLVNIVFRLVPKVQTLEQLHKLDRKVKIEEMEQPRLTEIVQWYYGRVSPESKGIRNAIDIIRMADEICGTSDR